MMRERERVRIGGEGEKEIERVSRGERKRVVREGERVRIEGEGEKEIERVSELGGREKER